MEKIIAAVITENAANTAKFYPFDGSGMDMYYALEDLSPDISDKSKKVVVLVTDAVDVSYYYNRNGELNNPFDKDQIALEDLKTSEGLIVTAGDRPDLKQYVIDPHYAVRECDVFFKSEWYHGRTQGLPQGFDRILAVEVTPIYYRVAGEPEFYYQKFDSWEDVLRVFRHFGDQICGGSVKKHKDVDIYLPTAISFDSPIVQGIDVGDDDGCGCFQDFCDEVAEKFLQSNWGGEQIEIDRQKYVVAPFTWSNIFSTKEWKTRFSK